MGGWEVLKKTILKHFFLNSQTILWQTKKTECSSNLWQNLGARKSWALERVAIRAGWIERRGMAMQISVHSLGLNISGKERNDMDEVCIED